MTVQQAYENSLQFLYILLLRLFFWCMLYNQYSQNNSIIIILFSQYAFKNICYLKPTVI